MYCSDWSNGIQYQVFDTRPDTESNSRNEGRQMWRIEEEEKGEEEGEEEEEEKKQQHEEEEEGL
jgi:hypothetical protein